MFFKKIIFLGITLFYCLSANAQFKLSGKVLNRKGKNTLVINVPLVYGTYDENATEIPIAKDGSFNIDLPIKEPKFVALIFDDYKHNLLLQPLKDLTLNLSATDKSIQFLAGSALPENKLMQTVDYREPPFFLNGHDDTNRDNFSHLSFNQLVEKIIKPFSLQQDAKLKIVEASSVKEKQIIADEIKYRSNYLLYLFAVTAKLEKPAMDSLILEVFKDTKLTSTAYLAGSYAYDFLEGYLRYIQTKAFIKVEQDKIPSSQPLPYYGISLDSAKSLVKQNGEPYGLWISSIKVLPLKILEPYIYQQIVELYYQKRLMNLSPLANAFVKQFPNSSYNASIKLYITQLKAQLAKNQTNKNIEIFEGHEKATSIYDVIKSLRGKVVYVDVWGTWCGPCKEEVKYNPALKAKFEGKDVAFVYLDMDEEDKDNAWREYIKVNALTGIHLRKNKADIVPFWKELLVNASDKKEYYPQYFIFDKEGNLVVSKAKRPSDKEELYTQIEAYLIKVSTTLSPQH